MSATQPYDDLARQLADAYTTGDAETIRRINWTRGTSFVWDRDPLKMQQRLGNWYASTDRSDGLAILDARNMVARFYGFVDWAALRSGVLNQAPDPRM